MHRFDLFTVFLLIFVFGIDCAKVNKINPKCDDKSRLTIDKQIGSVFPVLNGIKLPENEKQLQKYCVSVSHTIDNLAGYLKTCSGTFGPFIAKMFLKESNREMNSICKSDMNERIRGLLSVGQCVNSAGAGLQKCFTNALDNFSALNLAKDDDKFKLACCNTNRMATCVKRTMSKTKQCKSNQVQSTLKNEFGQMRKEWAEQCGAYYTNSAKCGQPMASAPKLNLQTYVRPKSFFIPLKTMLDNYRNITCTPNVHDKMDRIFAEMITIGTPDKIPESASQMSAWCSKSFQVAPFAYGYLESCVSDFGKLMAKVLIAQGSAGYSKYCGPASTNIFKRPSKTVQEYFKAAKCGNRAEDKIKLCMDGVTDGMMGIVEAPDVKRIKMACCLTYKFRTCLFNATSTTKGCSFGTIDWAERQIMEGIQPAVDFICPGHWNSGSKCTNLVDEIPKMDPDTYVRPQSVFIPMMKLMDSFPDVDLDSELK